MEERLNRIEEKLDKVSEAIISLARMEERMISLFKRMDTYDDLQAKMLVRVSALEVALANSQGSHKWIDRILVALLSGAITIAFFKS